MKYFLLFVVVLASANANDISTQINKDKLSCMKDNNVTEEAVKKLIDGDFSTNDINTKCFVKCFMKKLGFLNDKYELQEDVIVHRLSLDDTEKPKTQATINKCKSIKGADPCETAFKVTECYYNNKLNLVGKDHKDSVIKPSELTVDKEVAPKIEKATEKVVKDASTTKPETTTKK